LGEIIIIC